MSFHVQYISGQRWEGGFAANAHRAVFSESLPPEYDRVDFALLVSKRDEPVGYITARELDKESVYLKHGGAFPPAVKSPAAVFGYRAALEFLKSKYARITTLVENNNAAYLKIALTEGFVPIGIRSFKGKILVELFLEGIK